MGEPILKNFSELGNKLPLLEYSDSDEGLDMTGFIQFFGFCNCYTLAIKTVFCSKLHIIFVFSNKITFQLFACPITGFRTEKCMKY